MQSQKAVSAHFASEQILPFGFAEQYVCMYVCVYVCMYVCSGSINDKSRPCRMGIMPTSLCKQEA